MLRFLMHRNYQTQVKIEIMAARNYAQYITDLDLPIFHYSNLAYIIGVSSIRAGARAPSPPSPLIFSNYFRSALFSSKYSTTQDKLVHTQIQLYPKLGRLAIKVLFGLSSAHLWCPRRKRGNNSISWVNPAKGIGLSLTGFSAS